MKHIKEVNKQFHNHHKLSSLLSTHKDSQYKLQLPGDTQWKSQLVCLNTFIKNCSFYVQISQDHEEEFDNPSFRRYKIIISSAVLDIQLGHLHSLAVACWTTDHYHPCSNPGVGISEGCFVFRFVSLPLEVARPIQPTLCTKVAVKNINHHRQTSS